VRFIFQPAEEKGAGARVMIEEGLFEHFPVDAVYGMHNHPGMPVGEFGIRTGPMLAAVDLWKVQFNGTGGHGGADPHLGTDPTIVQAQFVLAAQIIIGRNIPAVETAVISVGHISGGNVSYPSVIPSEVVVAGTSRSFSASVRATIERRLREIAAGLAATHGCTARVDYQRGYPSLVNHPDQTVIAAGAAAGVVGADKVDIHVAQVTASEDFAYMLLEKPGAFMLIGNGRNSDGTRHNVHTPYYDFNDEILSLGSAYWVNLVHEELKD